LELGVLEVAADHELEDLEELSVGDEPILVHVIDLECDYRAQEVKHQTKRKSGQPRAR
jgi:hypothetical protein